MNPKKTPGHNKITGKMRIELPNIALVVLSFLFNAIFNFEYYPHSWKKSQIIVMDKI